jgi:hypothetical protein
VKRFMRQTLPTVNRRHFVNNIVCTESFCPQKRTTERRSSVVHSPSTVAIFTTETSLWTCAWAFAPRLSWSWTVLLPSDTYRKPIRSITAVLFPFVT